MFKNLVLMCDYVTFMKWQALAIASGCFLGWACKEWCDAYAEAKEAGVVSH